MAFYGDEFVFAGKSCREFGLMLYQFGSHEQEDVNLTANNKIHQEFIYGRDTSLFYGKGTEEPLTFTLVFGTNIESIDKNEYLKRYEIADIANWLTGSKKMQWLQIVQPDLDAYRYRCVISDLKIITDGTYPWAFSCKVICDSPYAHTFPKTQTYDTNQSQNITIYNKNTVGLYYKPQIHIVTNGCKNISIINHSDNDRCMQFANLSDGITFLDIDNENQIITSDNRTNMYEYFNFNYFRLTRGANEIELRGDGNFSITFTYEFLVNIGG